MTALAIRFRIISGADIGVVNIFVAIAAFASDFSETPFYLLFVTFIAGDCQMSPLERKGTVVVLFDGEQKFRKTLCSMTLGTIRRRTLL